MLGLHLAGNHLFDLKLCVLGTGIVCLLRNDAERAPCIVGLLADLMRQTWRRILAAQHHSLATQNVLAGNQPQELACRRLTGQRSRDSAAVVNHRTCDRLRLLYVPVQARLEPQQQPHPPTLRRPAPEQSRTNRRCHGAKTKALSPAPSRQSWAPTAISRGRSSVDRIETVSLNSGQPKVVARTNRRVLQHGTVANMAQCGQHGTVANRTQCGQQGTVANRTQCGQQGIVANRTQCGEQVFGR